VQAGVTGSLLGVATLARPSRWYLWHEKLVHQVFEALLTRDLHLLISWSRVALTTCIASVQRRCRGTSHRSSGTCDVARWACIGRSIGTLDPQVLSIAGAVYSGMLAADNSAHYVLRGRRAVCQGSRTFQ